MEFALVGPILFIFLLGIFAAGWAMHRISTLRLALEQSARALQIDPTLNQSQLQARVSAAMQEVAASDVSVTLATQVQSGVTVAVLTGTYNFGFTILMLPKFDVPYTTQVSVPLP